MRKLLWAVIIVALVVPVGLYSAVVYLRPAGDAGKEQESTDDDGVVPPEEIGDLKYLTLNTTVPSRTPKMNIYRLAVPDYSRAWCENKVRELYPGWLDGTVTIDSTTFIINITRFDKGQELITVQENGEFEYHNRSADEKWDAVFRDYTNRRQNDTGATIPGMISREQAYQVAVDYVRAHGGLPRNYVSFANHTSVNVHNDVRTNSSYTIVLSQKFDGYLLMEQCVMVYVTPLGDVDSYKLLWRETAGVNSTVTVVPAVKALQHLAGSGMFHHNTSIERIELGYSAESHFKIATEMTPVWTFYIDPESGGNVVVDAVGLKFP